MPAHSPPSPSLLPAKRIRQASPDTHSPVSVATKIASVSPTTETAPNGATAASGHGNGATAHASSGGGGGGSGGKLGQSSNFRNVSACNRCRLRKNRCDQRLPSCVSCEKAGVACVGYDPITKREIPRSYVFYLETRVEQLEGLLRVNNITYPPAEELEHSSTAKAANDGGRNSYAEQNDSGNSSSTGALAASGSGAAGGSIGGRQANNDGAAGANNRQPRLASKSGVSSSQGIINPRHLSSTAGMSFARVVFAAVQSSVSDQKSTSEKAGIRPYKPIAGNGAISEGTSMRDSFFGLHTKPTINPAEFPDRDIGYKLVSLYFEHANPQIPVLHREDFMQMFELAYAEEGRIRGPKELYMLNMVFAIGGGIIMGDNPKPEPTHENGINEGEGGEAVRPRQSQPEEYHASAIIHLEACLSNSGGGLDELQAVLLLANFALLRPVPPGLWYIVGVAVRLAVDLGLYYEDGKDVDVGLANPGASSEVVARERGRREYVRDLRRRLWWCTYSFDRLVSVCVGRPPSMSDLAMTTEFPSLLDDRFITHNGFLKEGHDPNEPTYKRVAHHYFRLRLLQSEIIQVLQYQQAQVAHASSTEPPQAYMNTDLPSPYLSKFDSFRSWRIDIDERLYDWKTSVPPRPDNGVAFSTEFLDLNYWQVIIMLYRQSLSVPSVFEGEYHTSKEVNSPTAYHSELREDEDRVYLKVAEAGQKILRLYRQLHLVGLVNYTYLATHHLFMAGISYLYAIWHSPIVRSRLSMDEVDFTILAATSVFTDLIDKCPPAEACRDAFDRTAKATIKMANSTGGFGHAMGQGYGSRRHSMSRSGGSGRVEWGFGGSTEVSPSLSNKSISGGVPTGGSAGVTPLPPPHQHRTRRSGDQRQQQLQQQQQHLQQKYDISESDAYSTSAASTTVQISRLGGQQSRAYRMGGSGAAVNGMVNIKVEPDGFSMMHSTPTVPRSNASSGGAVGSPEGSVLDPTGMLTSPTVTQPTASPFGVTGTAGPGARMSPSLQGTPPTPVASTFLNPIQQQQQQQRQQQQQAGTSYSPASQPFADLQGMEFLQSLSGGGLGGSGGGGAGGDPAAQGGMVAEPQMDFGFNFGWEGMHHDFNDGQQLDLFDGFFFGGQQSGGGGGGQNMGGGGM